LVAWLKEHPQPANQKYLDGLQAAMLGLSTPGSPSISTVNVFVPHPFNEGGPKPRLS
jgi:hypothetical protein